MHTSLPPDASLHEVLKFADILSPWSVGRSGTPKAAEKSIRDRFPADAAWCAGRGKLDLPVIFPGFSWRNLSHMRGTDAPLDAIPRLGGELLWSKARTLVREGATSIYVAMFDEFDEATAIMRTTPDVPVNPRSFVREPDVPNDHYLRLTGEIGRLLRKEIPSSESARGKPMPQRRN